MKSCKKHPLSTFNGRKCRECNKEYQAIWYANNKEKHINRVAKNNLKLKALKRSYFKDILFNAKCKCGEFHPATLHYHHVDSSEKVDGISKMVNNNKYSLNQLKLELEKCIVMCANCHAKITAEQFNWYKDW